MHNKPRHFCWVAFENVNQAFEAVFKMHAKFWHKRDLEVGISDRTIDGMKPRVYTGPNMWANAIRCYAGEIPEQEEFGDLLGLNVYP